MIMVIFIMFLDKYSGFIFQTRAGMVLGSILLSARDLFKLDLQGVQVLIPHVLQALEIVLPVPDSELVLGLVKVLWIKSVYKMFYTIIK